MIFKKQAFNLVLVTALLFAASGCKKDNETDLTIQVQGTYMGDYTESSDGSAITLNDVETQVTKKSATEIKVNIQVIPGLGGVVFNADMTDETHFTVPKFTLNDDELQGSGSLSGTALLVDLEKVGTASDKATFNGTKQ